MAGSTPNPETAGRMHSLDLSVEGFEGPLDLLLELIGSEKLDLSTIPLLSVIDQFIAVLDRSKGIEVSLAGSWLVMAAHLVWLKSKLLSPAAVRPPEAELAAEELARRVREHALMRAAASELGARPQLGIDVFGRGAGEDLVVIDRTHLRTTMDDLFGAYLSMLGRTQRRVYTPRPPALWTVQDALGRVASMLAKLPPAGGTLASFVPSGLPEGTESKAAVSATLIACLELARGGGAEIDQEGLFTEIMVRPPPADAGRQGSLKP